MKRTVLLIAIGLLLIGGGLFAYQKRVAIREWAEQRSKPTLPTEETYRAAETTNHRVVVSPPTKATSSQMIANPSATTTQIVVSPFADIVQSTDPLPDEKLLAVPFMSQAPLLNWDAVHEEACEEASMIMVQSYFNGERDEIASSTAEMRIQSLIDFETDKGYGVDVTAAETVKIIESRWPDLSAEVLPVTSVDEIKRFIANGIPVLIPANGKTLPNPNFKNGGPVYHMLVVRGYTQDSFITNDPGTRKGENFLYHFQDLMNSIHDWNGGDVPHGAQVMVVVIPKK